MGIFQKLFNSRDKPRNFLDSGVGGYRYYYGNTSAGKNVNPRNAMQITTVYSCVRIISETIASLPLHTYRYTDSGKEKAYAHPLYYLLHDAPNEEMTSFIFRETIMAHLLLWGNAYAQIIRNGLGDVVGLYPMLPNKTDVERGSDGKIYYIYQTDTQGQVILPACDVLHIPGLGFDGLVGYSPIAMTKNALGLGLASEEYGSRFFANGGTLSGVLEHPGKLKEPEKLRDAWERVYGGSSNAHKTAILEEGMKYTPISVNPSDAQFLETRKFQINEICRIFRVPPHMVADLEKSSFNNIEQQSLDFVVNTIRPWLVRIEQGIMQKLVKPEERRTICVNFNVDGLLRGDYQSRMRGYSIGIQNGFMSPNDVRELEGWNKIPAEKGGDTYFANGNFTKLEDAGNWNTKGGE